MVKHQGLAEGEAGAPLGLERQEGGSYQNFTRVMGLGVPPDGPVASGGGTETLPSQGPAGRDPGHKCPAGGS